MILINISVPNKDCTETYRNRSGWISAPDRDDDGLYDFNLNCLWTVEVDPSKLIRFQLMYVEMDYSPGGVCQTDILRVGIVGKLKLC